jgi:hypothetical protein
MNDFDDPSNDYLMGNRLAITSQLRAINVFNDLERRGAQALCRESNGRVSA